MARYQLRIKGNRRSRNVYQMARAQQSAQAEWHGAFLRTHPGSDGGPDGIYTPANTYSRGDLWVVRYKPGAEDGADVGVNDDVLTTKYANGEPTNGQDVVAWYCLRHHHQPRSLGEETDVVPYEFLGFRIEPRDFVDATIKHLYPTIPPSPL